MVNMGRIVKRGLDSFLWEIPEYSRLPKEVGSRVSSPHIDVAGTQWFLVIYPKGTKECQRTMLLHLWYVSMSGPGRTVNCTVGVRRADGEDEPVGTHTFKVRSGAESALFRFYKLAEGCVEAGQYISSDTLAITIHLREEGEAASQDSISGDCGMGPPPQVMPNPGPSPSLGGIQQMQQNNVDVPTQAWQQLLRTLELPPSAQQQQQVLAILKSNPQLMAAFIKRRTALQQQLLLQQQQRQQQQQMLINEGDIIASLVSQTEFGSPEVAMDNCTMIGNVVSKGGGRLEWTIPDFSTLPRRTGAFFYSPKFDVDGMTWCLEIHPNGEDSWHTWIRIVLFRVSAGNGKYLSCAVGLKRADHSEETIVRKAGGDFFYFSFNRTRRELEGGDWLPYGQLTVTCFIEGVHVSQGSSGLMAHMASIPYLHAPTTPSASQMTPSTVSSTPGFKVAANFQSSAPLRFGLETSTTVTAASNGFEIPGTSSTGTVFPASSLPQTSVASAFGITSHSSATPGFQCAPLVEYLVKQKTVTSFPLGVKKLESDYKKLLESGAGSDLLLVVSGREFPVHKLVLRARSS